MRPYSMTLFRATKRYTAFARCYSLWGDRSSLERLFENNAKWREGKKVLDPDYFDKISKGQHPQYLWIGCSDSRVPAEEITGLAPGEMFVHRNVANMVVANDLSSLAVVQFAVEHLKVKDIIVCGHYGCGGVRAAMENKHMGLLDNWLRNIRDVCRIHLEEVEAIEDSDKRLDRMVELNTIEQCINMFKIGLVQRHQAKYGFPRIHGLVYNIKDGQLKELDVNFKSYIKRYGSVFKLHSFTDKDPSGLHRGQLQSNFIKDFASSYEVDGQVKAKLLRRTMLQEPILFSTNEIEGAISSCITGKCNDASMVPIQKINEYFERQT